MKEFYLGSRRNTNDVWFTQEGLMLESVNQMFAIQQVTEKRLGVNRKVYNILLDLEIEKKSL